MDFSWTKEQLACKEAVAKFAQQELNHDVVGRDRKGEFSRELWQKCAEFGILGLPIPESFGGSGADLLTVALAMEGLGYGCRDNGLIFALNAQLWAVEIPLLAFGSDAQKEKYLRGLCTGQLIGAHAMTEPDAGSDVANIRTRAERVTDGYLLHGSKTFVTNAPIADVALVFANTQPSKGRWGITAFILDKAMTGWGVGRDMDKMGLRTSPMGELVFDNCFVPEHSRLGPEGSGITIFNHAMERERSGILASHIGVMERQLDECIRYARERRQFDQPIGKFQSVANRIANMKVRLETARLLLYKVAWLKTAGRSAAIEAAIVKLYLSECFVESSLDAIRIHGGYGYMTEMEVERNLRDALGSTIYSGTNDIQRVLIARLLGL